MRQIKFRQSIKHPVTGQHWKWHYWGLIDGAFVGIDTGTCSPKEAIERSQMLIGLPDKNDKEIYEGDILLTDEASWKAPVVYQHACFMLVVEKPIKQGGGFSAEPNWDKCEVIGNIYENKELLS